MIVIVVKKLARWQKGESLKDLGMQIFAKFLLEVWRRKKSINFNFLLNFFRKKTHSFEGAKQDCSVM